MSWQFKGWLWLAAALVAATLAAGTSGASPESAAHTMAVRLPCTNEMATNQPGPATAAGKPASCWHSAATWSPHAATASGGGVKLSIRSGPRA